MATAAFFTVLIILLLSGLYIYSKAFKDKEHNYATWRFFFWVLVFPITNIMTTGYHLHYKTGQLGDAKGKDYKLLNSIMGEPALKGKVDSPQKRTYWIYEDVYGWYSLLPSENMIVYIVNDKIGGYIIHKSITVK